MKSKRSIRKFIDKKIQEIKSSQNSVIQNTNVTKNTTKEKKSWPESLNGSYLNYAAGPVDRHPYLLQEKNANPENPPAYIAFQAIYDNDPLMIIRAGEFTSIFLGKKTYLLS